MISSVQLFFWTMYSIHHGWAKEGLIVGGVKARPEMFTHSVFLAMHCKGSYYSCGGSVINQRLVLTAAHCLQGCRESDIALRVGHIEIISAHVISCVKYIIHGKFIAHVMAMNMGYDIGIALAAEDFVFGPYLTRVVLTKDPPKTKYGYVAGWGIVIEGTSQHVNDLLYTRQRLLDKEKCDRKIEHMFNGTLCALTRKKSRYEGYPAAGDSGSALMVKEYIQIGFVSYRESFIDKGLTIYTSVSYFYDWIQNTSKKLICKFKSI